MASSAPPDLVSRILRHQRLIVAGGVALLAVLSWLFLIGGGGMGDNSTMPMSAPFSALVMMWFVMMVAMMLPSATPAILLYGRVREMRKLDSAIADSWVFMLGYLAAWLLFSVVAAGMQWMLIERSMTTHGPWALAAILLAAGVYQLSPLKAACISQCRSPAQFISRHWQAGRRGAVRLGVLHGAYCIGCCWTLMSLLFAGGVMNLLWIAGLTALIAIEKLAPRGPLFGRAAGVAMIGWGSAKLLGY